MPAMCEQLPTEECMRTRKSSRSPFAICCATDLAVTAPPFRVRALTSPSHTTSNTLWPCLFMSSMTRAFLTACWHIRGVHLLFGDDHFFLWWIERHAMDVNKNGSAVHIVPVVIVMLIRRSNKFVEPIVVIVKDTTTHTSMPRVALAHFCSLRSTTSRRPQPIQIHFGPFQAVGCLRPLQLIMNSQAL